MSFRKIIKNTIVHNCLTQFFLYNNLEWKKDYVLPKNEKEAVIIIISILRWKAG